MLFSEVIGQFSVKEKLFAQYVSGKVSHARLLTGKNGFGPLPLALAFAQFLNCGDKQENDSCGNCPSCMKYQKLAHPDLHLIFPVASVTKGATKPLSQHYVAEWREAVSQNPYLSLTQWFEALGVENKQGNISAEESNEIIKKVSLKPYEAEFKVFIIWMAEKMNASASNKLLKVLEEPPPKTLFFLVAENTENLLGTILSRVQMIKAERITEAEIKNRIILQYELPEKTAEKISLLSDGSWAEARKLAGADTHEDFYFETFAEWARLCFKVNIPEIITWVDKMAALGREKQKYFFNYALNIFRESLLQNYHAGELSRLMGKESTFKDNFAPFIHQLNAEALIDEISKASYHIERNANPKTVFLDLSLKVIKLLRIKSVTL